MEVMGGFQVLLKAPSSTVCRFQMLARLNNNASTYQCYYRLRVDLGLGQGRSLYRQRRPSKDDRHGDALFVAITPKQNTPQRRNNLHMKKTSF